MKVFLFYNIVFENKDLRFCGNLTWYGTVLEGLGL